VEPLKTEFRKAWCHLLLRCSLKTDLRKAWCHRVSTCHRVPPDATKCHLGSPWNRVLKPEFRKARCHRVPNAEPGKKISG
jgi:hypothetical protein